MFMKPGYGLSPRHHKKRNSLLAGDAVIALFGDSLEQHNGYGSNSANAEEHSNWSRGYMNWARIVDPRGRFDTWFDASAGTKYFNGQNQGVSGNQTSHMLARITNLTGITGLKVAIIGGGTNDLNGSRALQSIKDDLRAIYDAVLATGAKIIIMTVPPRPITGTDSWASGGAIRADWLLLSAWMQAQADADPARIKIVRRDLICSNADADRTPKTGYLNSDNVHFAPKGGYHVAADSGGLIEALAAWISPFTGFPAAAQSGDKCTSPTLTGSGGTVSTACTGVAPNLMRFRRSSGSNITAVGSKETINGDEYFKIVITRNGAGGTKKIQLDLNGNITTGLPSTGDWLRHAIKFKAAAADALLSIQLEAREQPSAGSNMDNYTMRSDTGYLWENVTLAALDGGGLWQLSPPWQWRASGTSIIFNTLINIDNSVAGTDTVWIGRMQLYPVSDPKPSLGF